MKMLNLSLSSPSQWLPLGEPLQIQRTNPNENFPHFYPTDAPCRYGSSLFFIRFLLTVSNTFLFPGALSWHSTRMRNFVHFLLYFMQWEHGWREKSILRYPISVHDAQTVFSTSYTAQIELHNRVMSSFVFCISFPVLECIHKHHKLEAGDWSDSWNTYHTRFQNLTPV